VQFSSEGDGHEPERREGFGRGGFVADRVVERFGAPIALLETPATTRRWVAQLYSDSSPTGTPTPEVGPALPVRLTIRHALADGAVVDVVTRRTYGFEVDLLDELWADVVDRRLAEPPADAADVQAWATAIALEPRPPTGRDGALVIDGTTHAAAAIVEADVTVVGCHLGDLMVTAVAPTALMTEPAAPVLDLTMWPPTES
jgi:hypothetical protein